MFLNSQNLVLVAILKSANTKVKSATQHHKKVFYVICYEIAEWDVSVVKNALKVM